MENKKKILQKSRSENKILEAKSNKIKAWEFPKLHYYTRRKTELEYREKKIIGFVPARGGSARVPHKNMRDIGGIPLFLRSCYNLHQILPKDSIVVDSDDEEILSIAKKHEFSTLKRPDELASNATDGNAFFRWETSNYPNADIYIQHLPPMPFLSKATLEKCLNAVEKEGYDSVVCVGKEHFYLWDEATCKPLYDIEHIPNSFTLPDTVYETMGLYVIQREAHLKTGLRIGQEYKMISLNKFEQIDINYPEDYDLAVAVERGLSGDSAYKI